MASHITAHPNVAMPWMCIPAPAEAHRKVMSLEQAGHPLHEDGAYQSSPALFMAQ